MVANNSSTSKQASSSQQELDDDVEDIDDDNDEVDSFDLTPELQHVGLHGDKNSSQAANNNIAATFLDTPNIAATQQQVLGNLNHVSTPTSPASTNTAVAAVVGVPVVPGVATNAGGATVAAAGTGKIVVAVYPFTAIEDGDLTLTKGT